MKCCVFLCCFRTVVTKHKALIAAAIAALVLVFVVILAVCLSSNANTTESSAANPATMKVNDTSEIIPANTQINSASPANMTHVNSTDTADIPFPNTNTPARCWQNHTNKLQDSKLDYGCGNDTCDFSDNDFSCDAPLNINVTADEHCDPSDGNICKMRRSLKAQPRTSSFYATLWFNLPDLSNMTNISCSEVNVWDCNRTFSVFKDDSVLALETAFFKQLR